MTAAEQKMAEALDQIGDLAIELCVRCRANIADKAFLRWAHDDIGGKIIALVNATLPADRRRHRCRAGARACAGQD
jgi:hypothetical protein